MDSLLDDIEKLEIEQRKRRARHLRQYGFEPYGIAMHPKTKHDLRRLTANCYSPWHPADSYLGLKVFVDVNIPRGEFQLLSEEAAREIYGGET